MIATSSPKKEEKSPTVCGVSEISGTSTITLLPRARTSSITAFITRVLPLPVTPYSSAAFGCPWSQSAQMVLRASSCSSVRILPSGASFFFENARR